MVLCVVIGDLFKILSGDLNPGSRIARKSRPSRPMFKQSTIKAHFRASATLEAERRRRATAALTHGRKFNASK